MLPKIGDKLEIIDGCTGYHCFKIAPKINTMPTKEQVLLASETSPEAKKALEQLFPEYFDNGHVDLIKWAKNPSGWEFGEDSDTDPCIGVDIDTDETGKRYKFLLSTSFEWNIVNGYLIPTKKP